MIRDTFIIAVVDTFDSLAIDADRSAGMLQRAGKRIMSFSSLREALTAGFITVARMFSAHHDIPFATQIISVVGTVSDAAF